MTDLDEFRVRVAASSSPPTPTSTAVRCRWRRTTTATSGRRAGKAFQNALADAGWPRSTYPVESGGAGLDAEHQKVFDEESADYEMPSRQFMVGIGICAPTLLEYGTDEQRRTYLPALLRGRRGLVPAVLRARRRFRRRQPADAGRARRRRVGRQRAEGVDVGRALRRLRPAASRAPTATCRSTAASACSSSTCTRRASTSRPAAPDRRRRALQRGVPRRRAAPRRRGGRRGRRRLARRRSRCSPTSGWRSAPAAARSRSAATGTAACSGWPAPAAAPTTRWSARSSPTSTASSASSGCWACGSARRWSPGGRPGPEGSVAKLAATVLGKQSAPPRHGHRGRGWPGVERRRRERWRAGVGVPVRADARHRRWYQRDPDATSSASGCSGCRRSLRSTKTCRSATCWSGRRSSYGAGVSSTSDQRVGSPSDSSSTPRTTSARRCAYASPMADRRMKPSIWSHGRDQSMRGATSHAVS